MRIASSAIHSACRGFHAGADYFCAPVDRDNSGRNGTPKRNNAKELVLGSIVVSIPACHAGDRGSIPRRGDKVFDCCYSDTCLKLIFIQNRLKARVFSYVAP